MTKRLFGLVMFWTVATTVFTWLPLVRILGRPEGYQWGILGLSGSGTEGPFWIFIPLTVYAVVLLFGAFRLPRAVFYPMLLLWHAVVTGVVGFGVVAGGADASLQGQGLHFSVGLWALAIPCLLFTGLAVTWVVLDHRAGGAPTEEPWSSANTRKASASLLLLAVALVLFRAGTNYNWVTAVAIVATVAHWILLFESFAPANGPRASASGTPSTEVGR